MKQVRKGFNIALSLLFFVISTIGMTQCYVDIEIDRDAQVHDLNSNNNYGQSQDIMAKHSPSGSTVPIQRALIDFDWSCFPDSTQIDSARLLMYFTGSSAGHPHAGENECWLQRINESWTESTVTWNNQPTTTTVNQIHLPSQSGTNDFSMLITPLVQDILNQPEQDRHGFIMKLQTEDGHRRQNYGSSDHSNNEKHPVLRVYLSNQSISVAASTPTSSDTIEFGDTATIEFQICNNTCCALTNESISITVPSGFTKIGSAVVPSSVASVVGSTLSISSLPAGECFDLSVQIVANATTVGGHYDVCLDPTSNLTIIGTSCSGTELISDINMSVRNITTLNQQGFSVHPNPNNGRFYLTLDTLVNQYEFTIIDQIGKTISKGFIQGTRSQEIDLRGFSKGVYFVAGTDGVTIYTRKIVIQ